MFSLCTLCTVVVLLLLLLVILLPLPMPLLDSTHSDKLSASFGVCVPLDNSTSAKRKRAREQQGVIVRASERVRETILYRFCIISTQYYYENSLSLPVPLDIRSFRFVVHTRNSLSHSFAHAHLLDVAVFVIIVFHFIKFPHSFEHANRARYVFINIAYRRQLNRCCQTVDKVQKRSF